MHSWLPEAQALDMPSLRPVSLSLHLFTTHHGNNRRLHDQWGFSDESLSFVDLMCKIRKSIENVALTLPCSPPKKSSSLNTRA